MNTLLKLIIPFILVSFLFGATLGFAESTAPHERHDRYHKMADDSHEKGEKKDSEKLKCACCNKKKERAHGDDMGRGKKYDCKGSGETGHKHDCDQQCDRHGQHHGHGGKGHHGGKSAEELEDLFK